MAGEELLELEIEPPHVDAPPAQIELEPEAELSWFTGALDSLEGDTAGATVDPPTLPPARGRLVDLGELARGGMASVRRAFDRNIRREIAIKRAGLEVRDAADFLIEEAQITGQLEHPNIVPVYDLGASPDGTPMFMMRLVHGRTLTNAMRAYWRGGRNPIELREILEVLLRVCDAVAYAHSRGVVHRDLKPDNVMMGTHGQVYVMDWGCALVLAGSDAQLPGMQSRRGDADVLLGTAAYMAPEQARGEIAKIDGRTDVYALGAILYQLLVERPPHRAATFVDSVRLAQEGKVTPPAEARPELDLPPTLVEIAMRAVAYAPADRYATVSELREVLDRFVAGVDWFPRRRFTAGTAIVRQGEEAYTAYVIESGTCEVSRDVMGTNTRVRRIGRGDVFGETSIFTDLQRSATVTAVTDVVAIEITRSAFEHRVGAETWLASFLRSLARHLRDAERRLDALGAAALYGRVIETASVYLHAAGVPGRPGKLQAAWTPLRESVARVLGIDETLVTEAVLGASDLTLDLDLDLLLGPE